MTEYNDNAQSSSIHRLCLRFQDADTASSVLMTAGPDGEQVRRFSSCELDVIGSIYRDTGRTVEGEDGDAWPEMERVPGYHVNLIGKLTDGELDELEPYIVHPENPVRVWL